MKNEENRMMSPKKMIGIKKKLPILVSE